MKIFSRNPEEAVSPVIAIILMVAITVVLASVLYVWVMNLSTTEDKVEKFPSLEISLYDLPEGDEIIIKHISGNVIKWEKYKILVTNTTNVTNIAWIFSPPGELSSSETIVFNATNTNGLDDVDYRRNLYYDLEIYDIKENKRVYLERNILCETRI